MYSALRNKPERDPSLPAVIIPRAPSSTISREDDEKEAHCGITSFDERLQLK